MEGKGERVALPELPIAILSSDSKEVGYHWKLNKQVEIKEKNSAVTPCAGAIILTELAATD